MSLFTHLGTQAQLQELQEKPESGELETPEIGSKEEHTGKAKGEKKRKNKNAHLEKRTGKAKREKKGKNKNAQPPPQVYTCAIIIT